MNFRADIQALRAIAILLVVFYHIHLPGFSGGFVGVDVFFVVSGYLITGLLVRELKTTGRINIPEFYARRVRRLLPAAALVVLCTSAISLTLLSPPEQQNFAGTALATALYISNVWFIRNATDYLAAAADFNPFLHTWSLSVEEQFYLVWPMLMLFLGRRGEGQNRRLVTGMGIVAAISLLASVLITRFAQPFAFFGSPTRAWEFAFGGLAVLIPPAFVDRQPRLAASLAWLGLVTLGVAAAGLNSQTPYPGSAALLPVLGTVAVLVSAERSKSISTLFRARPMRWFGDVSYEWYLWHWPVLVLAQAVVPGLHFGHRVLLAIASLGLAVATRGLLERRVRFSPYLVNRAALTLALALAVTFASAGATQWWRQIAARDAFSSQQRRFTQARADNPRTYENGCHLTYEEVKSPECAFGDAASRTTVVLFGDSHAAQWFPALERIALKQAWKLISLTKSACPAVDLALYDKRLGRDYTECDTWRRDSVERVLALKPTLVIVANSSLYVDSPERGSLVGVSANQWERGVRGMLERFNRERIRAVLLSDSPIPGFDVPTCLARLNWRPSVFSGTCTFRRSESLSAAVAASEERATSSTGVNVVNISNTICGNPICEPMLGEFVIYKDDHHLTAGFSASLAPALEESLRPLVAGASLTTALSETVPTGKERHHSD